MKTLRLLCILFFVLPAVVYAADDQIISQQARENVKILTQEVSALGVSEADVEKMFTLMHQNQFQHQNIIRATNILAQTARGDLPTQPVMNKALEGMAKKVPEEQVVKALESVRNRYTQAHRLAALLKVDRKTNIAVTRTIADSLAAGMNIKDVDTVVKSLQIRTREQTRNRTEELSLQTMLTVQTMSRLGGASADVSGVVCNALGDKYTAQQMEQLRHRFTTQSQFTSAKQLAHQYATGSTGKGSQNKGSAGSDGKGSGESAGGSGSGGNSGGGSGAMVAAQVVPAKNRYTQVLRIGVEQPSI